MVGRMTVAESDLHLFLHWGLTMPPRALPTPPPVYSHLPPRSVLLPAGLSDKSAPTIRRYAMHWVRHAAGRDHRRYERAQRRQRIGARVPGTHR